MVRGLLPLAKLYIPDQPCFQSMKPETTVLDVARQVAKGVV